MSLEERVYSALVVSASARFQEALASLLPESVYDPVVSAASVSEARRTLAQRSFDFIFISSPLPDDPGVRFAAESCRQGGCVTLLFVRGELYSGTFDRVSSQGVYVLPKTATRSTLLQALQWMVSTRERLRKFEKKLRPMEERMEEIRLVNRAKWLLIRELSMTEPDAHHYIERQAMDRCVPKQTVAEEIIRLYS